MRRLRRWDVEEKGHIPFSDLTQKQWHEFNEKSIEQQEEEQQRKEDEEE